jgi:proteasome lid subunit RPN8/RPN11
MTIVISTAQLKKIYAHAEDMYPEECCGILLGKIAQSDRTVIEVIPTVNAWVPADRVDESNPSDQVDRSKQSRYTIAPQDIFQAQKCGRDLDLEIIGFFHSHPDHPAIPSTCDRDRAWEVYSYPIVSVLQGQVSEIKSWLLDGDHIFQPEEIQIVSPA